MQTSLGFAPIPTFETGDSGFMPDTSFIQDARDSRANAPAVQSANPDPYGLTPTMSPTESMLPKSPLERIGVRLANMVAAVEGQPSYSERLMKMQQQQMEMDYNRLRIGTEALSKGMELIQNTPTERQEEVARQYGQMFEPVLGAGFSQSLLGARDNPERMKTMLDTYGELGETAIKAAGNLKGAEKLLSNQEWVKMQRELSIERNSPYVLHVFDSLEEAAQKDPQVAADWQEVKRDGITLGELRRVGPAFGLTEPMISAIRHSPDLQAELRSYGFIPQTDADLEAKEAIKAKNARITPTTMEVTENGRKFKVALDPQSGKELWRVGAGEATEGSRGSKTTSSDIRAAINLRLRGGNVADSGIAPGAIAATEGLDEDQLMALDASLQGGGMSVEVKPDGTTSFVTGSMAAQREARKAKSTEEERKATAGVMKLVNLADRVREMAVANPDSTNFGGDVARFINNFSADVVGTARTLGIDVTKNLNLPDDDPNKLTTLDPTRAPDAIFGELANRSAALKTAVFQLAIADAAANGQEGRGLSDKDFAASIRKVGGDVSSIGQLVSKIDEIERQHYDNLRIDYQTKHYDPDTGKSAAFMSLDDLRKRARGEDVAPAGGGEEFPLGEWKPNPDDRRYNPKTRKMDGPPKGRGYFGPLKRPDGGGDMTELGIGMTINGEEMEIPSLVPTLTADEVRAVLRHKDGERLPDSVYRKASDWAKKRIAEGKSPWATSAEEGKFKPGEYKDTSAEDNALIDKYLKKSK